MSRLSYEEKAWIATQKGSVRLIKRRFEDKFGRNVAIMTIHKYRSKAINGNNNVHVRVQSNVPGAIKDLQRATKIMNKINRRRPIPQPEMDELMDIIFRYVK